ncbi:MAG: hypothetical protein CXR31_00360 [Geobacter sp.]|nr:MAG: hypothetical protein CXR31_00360 [Geobacter sp.]
MTTSGASQFTAADSITGYLYQVRIALLLSLRRLPAGADFLVSVETLDDVTFETLGGTPQELLQTKHHRQREAMLTDASPDLWKTLRIWLEAYHAGQIVAGTALYLLTTAQSPSGSAASYLRTAGRDVEVALAALEATAQSSTNQTNASAYAVFLKTQAATLRSILNDVVVIDSSPSITALDQELRTVVFSAVERKHLESFLVRLEGWWFRRVLQQLTTSGDRILADELESQMSDLREQFKQESLPIDDDLLNFTLDEANQAAHADSPFVRQIELTKAAKTRIFAAVRDYYRAFVQRSRWIREDLLLVGELTKYERRLLEEWELAFAAMTDRCGEAATEETKERLARELLEWAEQAAPTRVQIRPRVTEPFVTRGSLHMLADKLVVGWHPEFRERLSALLKAQGAVA